MSLFSWLFSNSEKAMRVAEAGVMLTPIPPAPPCPDFSKLPSQEQIAYISNKWIDELKEGIESRIEEEKKLQKTLDSINHSIEAAKSLGNINITPPAAIWIDPKLMQRPSKIDIPKFTPIKCDIPKIDFSKLDFGKKK